MATVSVREITDKTTWEAFLANHSEANFLQSWLWGEYQLRLKHTVVRRGFYVGDQLVGVMQAHVEPARRGRHLVVPGGPILDWQQQDVVRAWRDSCATIAREHGCSFVRVRPQLTETAETSQLFKQLSFRRAPMHLHAELSSVLDLTKSDDELKKIMRKGTRYEINRAEKLQITVASASDDRFMDEFYDLQLQTAERQHFVPYSKRFLSEQFAVFGQAGHALMYRSSHEGQLLAMAFVIFYGSEAVYHYGASTDLARKLPGAYAVQWAAIKEARLRGCKRYNFWGITEHQQTQHRFYGVSVFKRGFGGDDLRYLPTHDLAISKPKYAATYAFETIRRKRRHL